VAVRAGGRSSGKLVCGDDAIAAEWVSGGEIYSDAYSLAEPTLGVIERALKLVERIET